MIIKRWAALLLVLMMFVSLPAAAENIIDEPVAETEEMIRETSEESAEPEDAGQGETPQAEADPENIPKTEMNPEEESEEEKPENPENPENPEDPESPVNPENPEKPENPENPEDQEPTVDSATETPEEEQQILTEAPPEGQAMTDPETEESPDPIIEAQPETIPGETSPADLSETEPTAETEEKTEPENPEIPGTPETPENQETPVNEETPENPEIPETLGNLKTSGNPGNPENPENPETPEPMADSATEIPEEEQQTPTEAHEETIITKAPEETPEASTAQQRTISPAEPEEPVSEAEAQIFAAPEGEAENPCEVLANSDQHDVLQLSDYANESNVEGFVYRMYKTVLQREPEEAGFYYWVNLLESGAFSAADVVKGFFNSTEYLNSGKTNEEIIKDCYYTMLNRQPDEPGNEFWKQRMKVGMTQDSIIAGFVESDEFTRLAYDYGIRRGTIEVTNPRDLNYNRTYFVYRLYQNCLGRKPDVEGEEFWCRMLAEGLSGSQVASGFFFSEEFNKNRYNNSAFVQILYKTILGREYDVNGLIDWTTKLNYSETREKVLNGFIGSEEFKGQCVTAQINPGDPIETPDNTVEWQYNIRVLRLCNQIRREAGLADLYTREDLLWDLAMARALETTVLFSHTRPDGTNCFSLFKEQGFYGYLGENLAAGELYREPAKVVEAWMNSEGHRENILNPKFTYLATGYIYDPDAWSYCAEGKYTGQYVNFGSYAAQSFCNYGIKIP